jgi:hypothetical protein
LASIAGEAFLAHAFEEVGLVDETLAVVVAVLSWADGRVVAFGHAVVQLLVEVGSA